MITRLVQLVLVVVLASLPLVFSLTTDVLVGFGVSAASAAGLIRLWQPGPHDPADQRR